MTLPSAEALAAAGIAWTALFALWKTALAPRLAKRHQVAANI